MTDIDIRSAWTMLPLLGRLFFLLLAAVAVKTVYSSSIVLLTAGALNQPATMPVRGYSVDRLRNTLASLRQLHTFTFFAFGSCISVLALDSYASVAQSKLTGATYVLDNFRYCLVYSAFAFCVLLTLHSVQWFVSARVNAVARTAA